MTTTRQLFASPVSSNSRRTQLCAAHLGIELELVMVNLTDATHRADVAKLNPNGKIPVFVEGDLILWESNAINQYLCECTPGQTLLPTEPRARANVNRWLFWQASHLVHPTAGLNFEFMVKKLMGKGDPDPAAVATHTAELARFAKVVDDHLATRTWLANDALSLADYSLAATLLHADRAQYPLQPFEHLRRHVAHVRETPAWRATEPKA